MNKSKGFSIVEALMAVSLMGIGGYFLVNMLKNTMSIQKGVSAVDDARALTADMAAILVNPTACLHTFGGNNPTLATSFSVSSIKNQSGTASFSNGGKYGTRSTKLNGISAGGTGTEQRTGLEKFSPLGSDSGIALVLVDWDKTNETAGPQKITRYFKIHVTMDAANKITSCYSLGGEEDPIWKRSLADKSNIYYNEGKVGLGISEPEFDVDVRVRGKQGFVALTADSPGTWSGMGTSVYSSTNFAGSYTMSRARGTQAAPLAVQADDSLGLIGAFGHTGTGFLPTGMTTGPVAIGMYAAGAFTNSSTPTFMNFFTTPSGANNGVERLRITSDGRVGLGTVAPLAQFHNTGDQLIGYHDDFQRGLMHIRGGEDELSGRTGKKSTLYLYNGFGTSTTLHINEDGASSGHIGLFVGNRDKTAAALVTRANNVGIGVIDPTAKLEVVGSVKLRDIAAGSSGYYACVNSSWEITRGGSCSDSDVRLKERLEPLPNSLERILKIGAYTYFWKDPSRTRRREIGLIAQEVEKQFPELVNDEANGRKSLDYPKLVAPVIKAINEFYLLFQDKSKKLDQLEGRLNQMEAENALLREELKQLKQKIHTIAK